MKFLHHLVVYMLLICLSKQQQEEKVNITMYYESLCIDCERFIVNQLYPGYRKIGYAINIDLVPYGKASHKLVNGTWQFICQHGPKECYGNKVQACVLLNYPTSIAMDFVGCIMATPDASSDKYIHKCAIETNVSMNVLSECTTNGLGDEFLAQLGDRTNQIKPSRVPMTWYNGKYDKNIENQAERDFMKTICGLFNNKPAGCRF